MDQSIVCLYFQNQQQSYMVNKHHKENPHGSLLISNNDSWTAKAGQDSPCEPDLHENLSEYELSRQARVQRNEEVLRDLGIHRVSDM